MAALDAVSQKTSLGFELDLCRKLCGRR